MMNPRDKLLSSSNTPTRKELPATRGIEIRYHAGTILSKLKTAKNSYNGKKDMGEAIRSLKLNQRLDPNGIKERQKFLLLEKMKAPKGTIDLGIYGNNKDGVDGKRGNKTETSTKQYFQWIFAHPQERENLVQSLENAHIRSTNRPSAEEQRKKRKQALEEKKRLLASLQEQKQHLEAEIKKEQLPSIPRVAVSTLKTISPAEQLMTETDKALKTLQAELTTVEKKQQIPHSDPSQRLTPTAKEYFGYTRDQDLVIFKEDGELLYKRAEELKQKVCDIGGEQAKEAIDAYELYIKNQLTSPIQIAEQALSPGSDKGNTDYFLEAKQEIALGEERMRQQGCSNEMIEAYKTEKIQRIATVQTAAFLAQQFSTATPTKELTISFEGIDGIEHTITFSVEEVTTVQQSAELAAFQFIYQKLIVEPYQDVTDQNYIDWDIPVAYNPHVEQLTDAVRQNNALETYLFDDPAKDPFVVHDLRSVHESEQAQTKEKLVDHYRTYFIEAESDPEEDKQSGKNTQTAMETTTEDDNTVETQQETQAPLTEKENTSLGTLSTDLDIYTTKRIRQLVLYQQLQELDQLFGLSLIDGKSLSDMISYDFTKIDITQDTISYPLQYTHLQTTLQIDLATGAVTMPDTLEYLLGLDGSVAPLTLSSITSATSLETDLQKKAKLTLDELLSCRSVGALHQRITDKLSTAINHKTPTYQTKQTKIAQTIEQQQLLVWRAGITHHNTLPTTAPSLPAYFRDIDPNSQEATFLTRLIDGSEGNSPLSFDQLHTITTIFKSNNGFLEMFMPCIKHNPRQGIRQFFSDIGLFERGPTKTGDQIVDLFQALDNMANSGVDPRAETGWQYIKQNSSISRMIQIPGEKAGAKYHYKQNKITPIQSEETDV